MGFFENAKSVQVYNGQFKEVHGDLFEYVDQSSNHGSFNAGASVGRGSHNRGRGGPGFSRFDFERIRDEAHARAAASRKSAERFGQLPPQNDGFQHDQRPPPRRTPTDNPWGRRSPEPMIQDYEDENGAHPPFQSTAASQHQQDPFSWARSGTEQHRQPPHRRETRPEMLQRASSNDHYYQPSRTGTAPPYLDPMRPGVRSPGYDPQSPPLDNYGPQAAPFRRPRQSTNPFAGMQPPDMYGTRQGQFGGGYGTNINSFNHNSTIIENAHNGEDYYGDDAYPGGDQQWQGRY